MKIAVILGTRPEIIKMSPVVRACEKRQVDFFILHTGQHYSYEMDEKIFTDLEMPKPRYNVGAGGHEFRRQIALMVREITRILSVEKPAAVLVLGDTYSVLAGALAANKLGIKIGHIEAGLRSHDLTMPEEINRILTDNVADYLFAPTAGALENLRTEGMAIDKIILSGNTIVDAVQQNLKLADSKRDILGNLNLVAKNYILATAHRAENVDVKNRLAGIFAGLSLVGRAFGLPVLYPMHPRTMNNVAKFSLKIPAEIKIIAPLGYLEFLQITANAKLVITDSGGLQEEACILQIPCVTVRDNTERPETITLGANMLAGVEPENILSCANQMIVAPKEWDSPFGDGCAGERIVKFFK